MKIMKNLLKLVAAVASIAGIAYLVARNIDAITDWLKNLCPSCKCEAEPTAEDTTDEVVSVEEAPAEDAPVEESSVDDAPVEEETPDEDADPIVEGEPVAEESDFEA